MLAHQCRWVLGTRSQRCNCLLARRGIAQAHRDITQPALVANTPNGRAFGVGQKLFLGPCEKRYKRFGVESVARREVLLGRHLGELIPWTHQLAVIAAKYPIAHRRPKFFGYSGAQLDSEIRDALTRVELIRRDECIGRAHVETGVAGAAVRVVGGVDGQRQIGE